MILHLPKSLNTWAQKGIKLISLTIIPKSKFFKTPNTNIDICKNDLLNEIDK